VVIKPGMVGELLIGSGVIDSAGLNRAQEARLKTGVSLGKALSDLGPARKLPEGRLDRCGWSDW
jgi:hypothetical protein